MSKSKTRKIAGLGAVTVAASVAIGTTLSGASTAPSIALVPGGAWSNLGGAQSFDVATGVDPVGATTSSSKLDVTGDSWLVDSAITSDGQVGLVADAWGSKVRVVTGLDGTPVESSTVDLSAFGGEGGVGYYPWVTSVDVTGDGNHALVGVDGRGVVVLARSGSAFAPDATVQTAGVNEDGNPHQPGFVRFTDATPFVEGIAIARVADANGGFTALGRSPHGGHVQVLKGVGATEALGGVIDDDRLMLPMRINNDYPLGNGGMAFSPVDSTRAVVTTVDGFAPVLLTDPDAPVLGASTPLGIDAVSVAVAPDGDTVVASDGGRLYFYAGLAGANASTVLTQVSDPIDVAEGQIRAIEFGADGRLLVAYDAGDNGALLSVAGIEDGTPTVGSDRRPLGSPDVARNGLSLFAPTNAASPAAPVADGAGIEEMAPTASEGELVAAATVLGYSTEPSPATAEPVPQPLGQFAVAESHAAPVEVATPDAAATATPQAAEPTPVAAAAASPAPSGEINPDVAAFAAAPPAEVAAPALTTPAPASENGTAGRGHVGLGVIAAIVGAAAFLFRRQAKPASAY